MSADAQTLARRGWQGSGMAVEPWWQSAVLYQIDPLSFQDSDGDGFGDLDGITQRLDYLQTLGVDVLVLSPFQLQTGFGPDSAGTPFDRKYGSAEDLDGLIQEASRRRMRVMVDLPLSVSHSVQELTDSARFWLSRGVAGLRLTRDEAEGIRAPAEFATMSQLSSAQLAERVRRLHALCAGYAGQRVLFWDLPRTLAAVSIPAGNIKPTQRSRAELVRPSRQRPPAAAGAKTPAPAVKPRADSVEMVGDARLAAMPTLNAASLRQALVARLRGGAGTEVPRSDGNDWPRSYDRYGDAADNAGIAKVLAAALLTANRAPLLYFGQEVGMATTPAPTSPLPGARESAGDPTPMQWGADAQGGFTRGVPWIDMGRNAASANVELENADQDSLLNWYRRLLALHHANAALRSGTLDVLEGVGPGTVAWVRRTRGGEQSAVVVVANLTAHPVVVSLTAELRRVGVTAPGGMLRTLATSSLAAGKLADAPVSANSIAVPPQGVYIGEVLRSAGLETALSPLRHASPRRRSGAK